MDSAKATRTFFRQRGLADGVPSIPCLVDARESLSDRRPSPGRLSFSATRASGCVRGWSGSEVVRVPRLAVVEDPTTSCWLCTSESCSPKAPTSRVRSARRQIARCGPGFWRRAREDTLVRMEWEGDQVFFGPIPNHFLILAMRLAIG